MGSQLAAKTLISGSVVLVWLHIISFSKKAVTCKFSFSFS